MSRTRQVDLGPMYLPVGEESSWPDRRVASREANRFADLMGGQGGGQSPVHEDRAGEPHIAPWNAVGERRDAAAQEASGEESLPARFEALWNEQASPLRREVRVGLGNRILPGMSLRMYEQTGMLSIEVHCGPAETTGWLVLRTPALVRELSRRLGKLVRFAVFEADGTPSAHSSWSAEDES